MGGLLSENITGNRRLISASFLLAALGLALMGPVPLLPWGSAGLQWAYKVSGMALVGIGVAFSVPLVPGRAFPCPRVKPAMSPPSAVHIEHFSFRHAAQNPCSDQRRIQPFCESRAGE